MKINKQPKAQMQAAADSVDTGASQGAGFRMWVEGLLVYPFGNHVNKRTLPNDET